MPGDCRLIAARDLFVNQALLTGEAYPAEKEATNLLTPVEQPGQAVNFVCMGTAVISGIATALVVHTGRTTELGGLAHGLAMERPRDAFERGIRQFGFLMLRLTVFLVLFVTVTNLAFHRPLLESLLFALALAVGLTPELLPMVVTVTLANGARRLAARRVIVKRLAAIHDLGAMDVLCTDKTGTLTESEIKLAAHVDQAGTISSGAPEVGVPFDNVDEDALKRPVHWNIGFIERFMLVLGPVSSLFDFLTFFALLSLFGAGEAMFQTGWFIESLATQCLVIFAIRTRGVPWRSKPHPLLTTLTLGAVGIGLLLPLTPLGKLLDFVEPPPGFYLFLVCAVAAYLLLVEIVKRQLYRRLDTRFWSARTTAHEHRRRAPHKAA